MLRALPVVLVLSVLSLAFAVPAHAVLITVNFTVTGDPSDPVNSAVTANGSFTFDSSLIPTGGGEVGDVFGSTDYASSVNFSWDGTDYDSSNSGVNYLVFNQNGLLTNWLLGADFGGMSNVHTGPGDPDDFRIGFGNPYAREGVFTFYAFSQFSYTVDYGTGGTAPEPASLLLFGSALVGLVGVRRRARK